MKMQTMYAMVLGCTSVFGTAAMYGQATCSMGSGMKGMGADADKQFVTQAALSDFTEIKFSQLALQKSNDAKVKAYAQKMITDHNALEADMKPFASQLGVTPPTELDSQHQQLFDQVSQLSGPAFDKQYIAAMSADHHKALDLFKQQEAMEQNKAMKPVLKKGEKVVAQHTAMADKMNGKMGGSMAGM